MNVEHVEVELLYAKLVAQICSASLSAFFGIQHIRSKLAERRERLQREREEDIHTIAILAEPRDATAKSSSSRTSAMLRSVSESLRGTFKRKKTYQSEANSRRSTRPEEMRTDQAPPSTRILRAQCASDFFFSLFGGLTTSIQIFDVEEYYDFWVMVVAQAPHWCGQVSSFCWMIVLAIYIAKEDRSNFDVTIAHCIIWVGTLLYYILELYTGAYHDPDATHAAKIIWKVIASSSFLSVVGCWIVFAHRRKKQLRENKGPNNAGIYVFAKLLSYTLAYFAFVSPNIIVDLASGLQSTGNIMGVASVLLAIWPTANALIYFTRPTPCLSLFRSPDDQGLNHGDSDNAGRRIHGMTEMQELKGLKIERKIGQGIAVVHLGTWRGAQVAVKMQSLMLDESEILLELQDAANQEIQAEAEVMKELKHPNIVLFMEAGFYNGSICIVSEYCARGSLRDVLKEADVSGLQWSIKVRLALGIAHGMQYLHNANPPMIHRDLKSPNVLVDDSWHAKIADFGTLRFAEIVNNLQRMSTMDGPSVMTGLVGTTRWMAPEVIKGEKIYSSKVDIYSLGLILWELIEGKLPFEDIQWNTQIEDRVLAGERPEIGINSCPMRWSALVKLCWSAKPEDRPEIQSIIKTLHAISHEEPHDGQSSRLTNFSFSTNASFSTSSAFNSFSLSPSSFDMSAFSARETTAGDYAMLETPGETTVATPVSTESGKELDYLAKLPSAPAKNLQSSGRAHRLSRMEEGDEGGYDWEGRAITYV